MQDKWQIGMMWVPKCVSGPVVSGKQQSPDEQSPPQNLGTMKHSVSQSHYGQGILLDAIFGRERFMRHLEVGEEQRLEKEGEGLGATEVEQYFIGNTTEGVFEDSDDQDGSNVGDEDDRYESEYQITDMSVEVEDYERGEQDPKPQYLKECGNLKRKYSGMIVVGDDEGVEVSFRTLKVILA